ncbi:MAG: hypothetical protein A3G75_03965 [Verrucomicrobia bacterium RIFCSPLOWO2_12_FULL_64_8]|nr:MAG: hypothetical protein A3G75_03965 [Verrucomicrobia bacterium RIFCSPLOWO2_12_FULL_64_8]
MKLRDPRYVDRIDRWFAGTPEGEKPPPPMFTPLKLRDLVLPNRIVVSPMCMYSADDGTIDDWHLVHLGSRAVGGAGLVVTEMTDVSREARITPGCAGMYKHEHVGAWKRVVEFVHRFTPAKIAMQLAHAGRKGSTKLAWEGMDEPLSEGGWEIVSASPIPYTPKNPAPREMTRAEMDAVRDDFVRATKMCDHAGFDMIELHMAHGYLLASFLSPLTNVRQDEYGKDRLKYPLEVFAAVRAAWPAGKPISVRISATDWEEGGNTGDDAVEIARALHAAGADIIDVSAGQTVPTQRPVYGRAFQTPFSDRIRQAGVPTMTVGNLSSFGDVNGILAAGRADLCVMARAHLWDPYWTRHAAYELGYELPWPPPYAALTRYSPRFK